MTVEIISLSISTKVWDRAGIELATPGSAVRHASVARHVTDCDILLNICFIGGIKHILQISGIKQLLRIGGIKHILRF